MSSMADPVEAAILWGNMNHQRILYYNKGPFHNFNVGAKQIKNRNKPRFHDVA